MAVRITLTAHLTDGASIEVLRSLRGMFAINEALTETLRHGVRDVVAADAASASKVTIVYPPHRISHFSIAEIDEAKLPAAPPPTPEAPADAHPDVVPEAEAPAESER